MPSSVLFRLFRETTELADLSYAHVWNFEIVKYPGQSPGYYIVHVKTTICFNNNNNNNLRVKQWHTFVSLKQQPSKVYLNIFICDYFVKCAQFFFVLNCRVRSKNRLYKKKTILGVITQSPW